VGFFLAIWVPLVNMFLHRKSPACSNTTHIETKHKLEKKTKLLWRLSTKLYHGIFESE